MQLDGLKWAFLLSLCTCSLVQGVALANITVLIRPAGNSLKDSTCLPDKNTLIPFRVKNKWGYSNVAGELIIPAKYDSAGHFGFNKEKKPVAKVKVGSDYFFINSTGAVVHETVTEDHKVLIKNGIIFQILEEQSREISIELYSKFENGKYGFQDNGKTIVQPMFNDFGFHDQDVFTLRSSKWMLFSTKGDTISTHRYDTILNFNGQPVGIMKRDGKFGLLNRTGIEIVKPIYREIYPLFTNENLIIVRGENGKYGLIDMEGNVIEKLKYSGAQRYYFSEFKLHKLYTSKKQFVLINCEGKRYSKQ